MKMYRYIEYLERIDGLIRRRQTGSPADLAARLNISERTVFRIIAEMRENGIPICFSKKECTYYYESPVSVKVEIHAETTECL